MSDAPQTGSWVEGTGPAMSVVICAYNEEAVIARCLGTMTADATPGELEIIVVCNGCSDGTAAVARRCCPEATVLETSEAGKPAALNLGDTHATAFPRFYVDADVEVDVHSLRRVAEVLRRGDVDCAAPAPQFEVERRNWAIRSFYRIWRRLPYLNDAVVGSGVYALSEAGRSRFATFPNLTADDQFVMQQFPARRRRSVRDASFTVHVPARLSDLVAVRTRVYRGNAELASSGESPEAPPGGRGRALARLVLRPKLLPALVVYVAVNAVATRRARRPSTGWERDESSRSGPAPSAHRRQAGSVAYLVSRYPSISHTFILREVGGVRAAGVDVATFSVVATPPVQLLTEAEREAAASTWSIRPVRPIRVLVEITKVAVTHPGALWGTLWLAVRDSPPGVRARLWRAIYTVEALLLGSELRRRQVRHVHAHLANVASDVAWLCAELGERVDGAGTWSWSMSIHGPTELLDASRYGLPSKVRHADFVLCISDFARSQLMALSEPAAWSKLEVVHMGVDLDRYQRPSGPRHEERTGELLVLCVGRLDPVKGQAILVEAFAALLAEGRRCRLVIVGGGPAEDALRGRVDELAVGERVDFTGPLGQDRIVDLYADADVFCLPSFAEGLPVVLMEALASELPVVTTSIAGIPELVEDGVNGLLVPPGRVDRLTDALRTLADDAGLRREMGRRGRVKVMGSFDARSCGRQVADVFRARVPGGAEWAGASSAPAGERPADRAVGVDR